MTAMAASPSAYVNGDNSFSDPMTARHNFQSQYDLDNPVEAVACYARVMHQHTKSQMDSATRAARRRSSPSAGHSMSSLNNQSSMESRSSVDSGTSN